MDMNHYSPQPPNISSQPVTHHHHHVHHTHSPQMPHQQTHHLHVMDTSPHPNSNATPNVATAVSTVSTSVAGLYLNPNAFNRDNSGLSNTVASKPPINAVTTPVTTLSTVVASNIDNSGGNVTSNHSGGMNPAMPSILSQLALLRGNMAGNTNPTAPTGVATTTTGMTPNMGVSSPNYQQNYWQLQQSHTALGSSVGAPSTHHSAMGINTHSPLQVSTPVNVSNSGVSGAPNVATSAGSVASNGLNKAGIINAFQPNLDMLQRLMNANTSCQTVPQSPNNAGAPNHTANVGIMTSPVLPVTVAGLSTPGLAGAPALGVATQPTNPTPTTTNSAPMAGSVPATSQWTPTEVAYLKQLHTIYVNQYNLLLSNARAQQQQQTHMRSPTAATIPHSHSHSRIHTSPLLTTPVAKMTSTPPTAAVAVEMSPMMASVMTPVMTPVMGSVMGATSPHSRWVSPDMNRINAIPIPTQSMDSVASPAQSATGMPKDGISPPNLDDTLSAIGEALDSNRTDTADSGVTDAVTAERLSITISTTEKGGVGAMLSSSHNGHFGLPLIEAVDALWNIYTSDHTDPPPPLPMSPPPPVFAPDSGYVGASGGTSTPPPPGRSLTPVGTTFGTHGSAPRFPRHLHLAVTNSVGRGSLDSGVYHRSHYRHHSNSSHSDAFDSASVAGDRFRRRRRNSDGETGEIRGIGFREKKSRFDEMAQFRCRQCNSKSLGVKTDAEEREFGLAEFGHVDHFHFIIYVEQLGVLEYCATCFENHPSNSHRRQSVDPIISDHDILHTEDSQLDKYLEQLLAEEKEKVMKCQAEYEEISTMHSKHNDLETEDDTIHHSSLDDSSGGDTSLMNITVDLNQLLNEARGSGMSRQVQEDLMAVYNRAPIPKGVVNLFGLTQLQDLDDQIKIELEEYCHVHFVVFHPKLGVAEFCRECDKLRWSVADTPLQLSEGLISRLMFDARVYNLSIQAVFGSALRRLRNFYVPSRGGRGSNPRLQHRYISYIPKDFYQENSNFNLMLWHNMTQRNRYRHTMSPLHSPRSSRNMGSFRHHQHQFPQISRKSRRLLQGFGDIPAQETLPHPRAALLKRRERKEFAVDERGVLLKYQRMRSRAKSCDDHEPLLRKSSYSFDMDYSRLRHSRYSSPATSEVGLPSFRPTNSVPYHRYAPLPESASSTSISRHAQLLSNGVHSSSTRNVHSGSLTTSTGASTGVSTAAPITNHYPTNVVSTATAAHRNSLGNIDVSGGAISHLHSSSNNNTGGSVPPPSPLLLGRSTSESSYCSTNSSGAHSDEAFETMSAVSEDAQSHVFDNRRLFEAASAAHRQRMSRFFNNGGFYNRAPSHHPHHHHTNQPMRRYCRTVHKLHIRMGSDIFADLFGSDIDIGHRSHGGTPRRPQSTIATSSCGGDLDATRLADDEEERAVNSPAHSPSPGAVVREIINSQRQISPMPTLQLPNAVIVKSRQIDIEPISEVYRTSALKRAQRAGNKAAAAQLKALASAVNNDLATHEPKRKSAAAYSPQLSPDVCCSHSDTTSNHSMGSLGSSRCSARHSIICNATLSPIKHSLPTQLETQTQTFESKPKTAVKAHRNWTDFMDSNSDSSDTNDDSDNSSSSSLQVSKLEESSYKKPTIAVDKMDKRNESKPVQLQLQTMNAPLNAPSPQQFQQSFTSQKMSIQQRNNGQCVLKKVMRPKLENGSRLSRSPSPLSDNSRSNSAAAVHCKPRFPLPHNNQNRTQLNPQRMVSIQRQSPQPTSSHHITPSPPIQPTTATVTSINSPLLKSQMPVSGGMPNRPQNQSHLKSNKAVSVWKSNPGKIAEQLAAQNRQQRQQPSHICNPIVGRQQSASYAFSQSHPQLPYVMNSAANTVIIKLDKTGASHHSQPQSTSPQPQPTEVVRVVGAFNSLGTAATATVMSSPIHQCSHHQSTSLSTNTADNNSFNIGTPHLLPNGNDDDNGGNGASKSNGNCSSVANVNMGTIPLFLNLTPMTFIAHQSPGMVRLQPVLSPPMQPNPSHQTHTHSQTQIWNANIHRNTANGNTTSIRIIQPNTVSHSQSQPQQRMTYAAQTMRQQSSQQTTTTTTPTQSQNNNSNASQYRRVVLNQHN